MSARVTRGSDGFDERAVARALAREGLSPHGWSNGPGDVYAAHSHAYYKVLYCVRGSVVFRLTATGEDIELHAGDRLDIESQTEHSAIVGPHGVACLEAAREG